MQETWVRSLDPEDPLEKEMATHSIILAGKSHGQRSLAGYSPWGFKESDTTEETKYIHKTLRLVEIFISYSYQDPQLAGHTDHG